MDSMTFLVLIAIFVVVIAGIRESGVNNKAPKVGSKSRTAATSEPVMINKPKNQKNTSKEEPVIVVQKNKQRQSHKLKPYLKPDGTPINSETERELWLEVRRTNVSATDARKLVKLNGQESAQRSSLLEKKLSGDEGPSLESYELGIEREPHIAAWVINNFESYGFQHSKLLYIGKNPRHIATPDLVGINVICEIKVSNMPLQKIKSKYRDQLQWQMHVTGLKRVLFVVENRETRDIEHEWIERDPARVNQLSMAADQFIVDLDSRLQIALDSSPNEFEPYDEEIFSDFIDEHGMGFEDPFQDNLNAAESPMPSTEKTYVDDQLTFEEEKLLVKNYIHGYNIYDLADKVDCTPALAADTLSRIIFNLEGDLVDVAAENFGNSWSKNEVQQLCELYRESRSIPEIATALGRDQLGACFKIFEYLNPPVPKDQLVRYGITA